MIDEDRKRWYRRVARDLTNAEVEEYATVRDEEATSGGAWVEAWVFVTMPDEEDELENEADPDSVS